MSFLTKYIGYELLFAGKSEQMRKKFKNFDNQPTLVIPNSKFHLWILDILELFNYIFQFISQLFNFCI